METVRRSPSDRPEGAGSTPLADALQLLIDLAVLVLNSLVFRSASRS